MKTLVSILRDSIVKTIKTLGRKRTVKDLHTWIYAKNLRYSQSYEFILYSYCEKNILTKRLIETFDSMSPD